MDLDVVLDEVQIANNSSNIKWEQTLNVFSNHRSQSIPGSSTQVSTLIFPILPHKDKYN